MKGGDVVEGGDVVDVVEGGDVVDIVEGGDVPSRCSRGRGCSRYT